MKINSNKHYQRPVKASIDLKALGHNLQRVRDLAPHSKIVSVIKANAYGHGVLQVAKALHKSDMFAVARLDEALFLRANGIDKPIVLLEGVFTGKEYNDCCEHQLIPAIHCLEQFDWLQAFICKNSEQNVDLDISKNSLVYWLKVDTGMHRLGLSEKDITKIQKQLNMSERVHQPVAIMSHFACADEINSDFNANQMHLFTEICAHENWFSLEQSMANSAAIISIPQAHYNWVRPGIMLYGISPFETAESSRTGLDEQLLPVMTLSSEIIAIKQLKQGDCIGYGATWCCPEDMLIGVIAMGYGDGYPRHAPSGTPVLIHGIEVPLVGRVSMDMITVDLRPLINQSIDVQMGDKVILWGQGLPIERVSQKANTIAYELVCQVTQRVQFEYE